MKPVITWILLANTASARILENRGAGEGLFQLPNHSFNAPEIQPYSDDEGRTLSSTTSARVRLDKHVEHSPESEMFSRELVQFLLQSHRNKEYDYLIVCAAPGMLGLLRQQIPEELKTSIKTEMAKDLVNVPNDKLVKHFQGILKI